MKKQIRMLMAIVWPIVGMVAGYAQADNPPPAGKASSVESMFARAAGKTLVFCVNANAEIRRRLEGSVAVDMKSQGFDVYEGSAQIPRADQYSAEGLAAFFHKAGYQSIAEVTYTGDIPKAGLPRNLNFNLHTLPNPKEIPYPSTKTTLEVAVVTLMGMLDRVKLEAAPAQ